MAEAINKVARSIENVIPTDVKEGELTKMIENQTSKIPSVFYLNLALGSIAISAFLGLVRDRKPAANFVGLWAPTFLLLGIYNKLVKLEGNDFSEKPQKKSA